MCACVCFFLLLCVHFVIPSKLPEINELNTRASTPGKTSLLYFPPSLAGRDTQPLFPPPRASDLAPVRSRETCCVFVCVYKYTKNTRD